MIFSDGNRLFSKMFTCSLHLSLKNVNLLDSAHISLLFSVSFVCLYSHFAIKSSEKHGIFPLGTGGQFPHRRNLGRVAVM